MDWALQPFVRSPVFDMHVDVVFIILLAHSGLDSILAIIKLLLAQMFACLSTCLPARLPHLICSQLVPTAAGSGSIPMVNCIARLRLVPAHKPPLALCRCAVAYLLQLDDTVPALLVAKLTDFGLSVALEPNATHVSNYTSGTPFYVAPEVLTTNRLSTASDVYSLGIVIWCVHSNAGTP